MKRYMVIVVTDEGQEAHFFDQLKNAESCRMDASVSLGWYAEVYEYKEIEEGTSGYELLYA